MSAPRSKDIVQLPSAVQGRGQRRVSPKRGRRPFLPLSWRCRAPDCPGGRFSAPSDEFAEARESNDLEEAGMTIPKLEYPRVVSRAEWLEARKRLLVEEK